MYEHAACVRAFVRSCVRAFVRSCIRAFASACECAYHTTGNHVMGTHVKRVLFAFEKMSHMPR